MTLVNTPLSSVAIDDSPASSTTFEEFLNVLRGLRLTPLTVTININERSVIVDHKNISLSKQELELLVYLVTNRDRTVSRSALFSTVWSDRDLDEDSRTVDAHIRRLRRKLDINDLITTVRGEGYRFNSTPNVQIVEARSTELVA